MANFFIWSKDGDSSFLLQRLLREGHDGRMYIHNKESRDVGKGLIPLTTSQFPRRDEIVIFDMTGFGFAADRLRRSGYKVLSGGSFGDKLELDRGFALDIARGVGIAVPNTREFTRLRDAVDFLSTQDRSSVWYLKPSGDASCASTHGSRDVADMLRWLVFLEQKKEVPKKFLLQEKMDNTAELSFEGWFDGKRWVLPWNSTIEDKKLMAGDRGPNTGCMANLVWTYVEPMPLLAMRTLTRLNPLLKAAGYTGPLDVNLIFNDDGVPHWIEFTPRPGYLSLQALMALIKGDLGAQLVEFLNGTLERFDTISDYSLAINVTVPPYPHAELAGEARWTPLDPRLLYDPVRIMPTDVMVVDGRPYITGSDAGVAAFVDTGPSVAELRASLLERIADYAIPDAQYRTDPVQRAEEELEFLKEKGYEVPGPFPKEGIRIPAPEIDISAQEEAPLGKPGAGAADRRTGDQRALNNLHDQTSTTW